MRDLARAQCRARRFDHDAKAVIEVDPGRGADGGGDGIDAVLDDLHLALGGDEGQHDLRHDMDAATLGIDRRLEDRAGLHLVDLGHGDAQADPTHPQHRVEFRQRLDPAHDLALRAVQRLGQFAHSFAVLGQEFVQGRIEKADADRQARHDVEERDEIGALHRQEPVERDLAVLGRVGKDHLTHHGQAVFVKEHVFGAAKADALGLEHPGGAGVVGRVGIGAHADVAHIVGPVQKRAEPFVKRGFQHFGRACKDLSVGAIDGDRVALAEGAAVAGGQAAVARVDADFRGADDAGQAKAARDHGGVAGHAAAFGQDGDGGVHAANILGRGFAADQDAAFVPRRPRLRGGRGEDDPARGRAGAGGDAARHPVARQARVDLVVQQFGERTRLNPQDRLIPADDTVLRQLHRDPDRGAGGSLHPDRVDHAQRAVLQREFDLHLLAQFRAAIGAVALQVGKDPRRGLFQRMTALVLHKVKRFLGLAIGGVGAAKAPGDLRRAGHAFDKLDGPLPRQARPEGLRHFLHDEAQRRIGGRALRLPQKPGGRAFPGARHRAQHLGHLAGGRLGEFLLHLVLIGGERFAQRLGRGFGGEKVGVEPRNIDRIGLDKAQIHRVGHGLTMRLRDLGVFGGVQADVQHRGRPAPVGVFRRGADGDEAAVEDRRELFGIGHLPGGDGADGFDRQRDRRRHGQVQADQPLQAFRAPAMARGIHRRRGRYFGEGAEIGMFLHCGEPFESGRIRGSRHLSSATIGGSGGGAAPAPPEYLRHNERAISLRVSSGPPPRGKSGGCGTEGSGGCGGQFRCHC